MSSRAIYVQPAPWARDDTEAELRSRRRLAIGIAISLVVHAVLFILLPKRVESEGAAAQTVGPLEVRLSQPPPAAAAVAVPTPPVTIPPPRQTIIAIPRIKAKEPSFAIEQPKPPSPLTPEPEPPSMMAMVEAAREHRRLAEAAAGRSNAAGRGESSAEEIRNANINRNLQTLMQPKEGTNGVFQILHMGHRASEFAFRGWTSDERASVRQVYEVDAGQGGNVELATVRKMIEIIRSHYQDKFNWESHKLGRVIQLSARIEDSANLETFLIREFFGS